MFCNWHEASLVVQKIADPHVELCMQDQISVLFLKMRKCPHITQRGNRSVLQDAGWMKVAIHYCDLCVLQKEKKEPLL